MKKMLIISVSIFLLSSCKKEKIHDPFEGVWYLHVPATIHWASYFRLPLFEASNVVRSPVKIASAGEGKYYITDTSKQMNSLDYNQASIYITQLKPKTNANTQQFVFEKVTGSDSYYLIKSASNPDKLLSVEIGAFFPAITFQSVNTSYYQQWELEK